MSKLRIKVSGCMRSMTGAEIFCTLRSYIATAARHGISPLEALTLAAQGTPQCHVDELVRRLAGAVVACYGA